MAVVKMLERRRGMMPGVDFVPFIVKVFPEAVWP